MKNDTNFNISEKPIRLLVWLTFLFLFLLAFIFFMERTLIMDASFQCFSLLVRDGFAIQENRFGAIIVQIFPLLASKAGLSLKAVLVLYSLAYIVEAFICFLILWRGGGGKKSKNGFCPCTFPDFAR
jgi:hypothetical protein